MNILITGVSRGLGFYLCKKFLSQGHFVIGISRTPVSKLDFNIEHNVQFLHIQLDITQSHETTIVLENFLSNNMIPEVVILNAGGIKNDGSNNFNFQNFQEIMKLNLFSSMEIVNILLPIFQKRGSGIFVAISSVAAIRALSSSIGYPTSKSALSMAFEGLRLQYSHYGLRFITIQPGFLGEKKKLLGTSFLDAAEIIYHNIMIKKNSEVVSFPMSIVLISRLSKLIPDKLLSIFLKKTLQWTTIRNKKP